MTADTEGEQGAQVRTIRCWAAGLDALHARIAPRFRRAEVRAAAGYAGPLDGVRLPGGAYAAFVELHIGDCHTNVERWRDWRVRPRREARPLTPSPRGP